VIIKFLGILYSDYSVEPSLKLAMGEYSYQGNWKTLQIRDFLLDSYLTSTPLLVKLFFMALLCPCLIPGTIQAG
jgi:hypothetical protein